MWPETYSPSILLFIIIPQVFLHTMSTRQLMHEGGVLDPCENDYISQLN